MAANVAVGAVDAVGIVAVGLAISAVVGVGEAPGHPAPTQVVRDVAKGSEVAVGVGPIVAVGWGDAPQATIVSSPASIRANG